MTQIGYHIKQRLRAALQPKIMVRRGAISLPDESKMTLWEYCKVDFDGSTTSVYFHNEAGEYIDHPAKLPRLGDHFILMAQHIERKQNGGK